MKIKTKIINILNLWKGFAGILLSVSVFVLPVKVYAETAAQPANEAVQEKYVMPQEQVYLDPSQVEAAKQQKAEDARYNAQPQTKNVEVVSGDRVIADVKVVEKDETGNVNSAENSSEAKKAEEEQNTIAQPENKEAEKPVADVTKESKEKKPETLQQQEPVKEKTEMQKAAAENTTQSETKTNEITTENKKENQAVTLEQSPAPKHKPVHLHRFGVAKEITTRHSTVGEVLREMKVNLEGRTVYPPLETKITDGMIIHVLARKSFLSQEEVEVPFGTQVINDPEMAFGTKKVEKEGVKGKDLVTYENITRPGREQKIELDRQRVAEPVNEVVRQGVAQSVLTPEGYKRYTKKIYGEATAYTWGGGATGHTSIGLWPKRGIVAVDPRVIPYYTKLFIPGYGIAIAGDTGGAIVGTRIDLFMDSLYECFQWGRRDVEIYILE
jgi:3D (Asp-Asp-Asp) domain-containing protein